MATYTFESRHAGVGTQPGGERLYVLRERPAAGIFQRVLKAMLVLALFVVGLFALSVAIGMAVAMAVYLMIRGRRRPRQFRAGKGKFPDTVS